MTIIEQIKAEIERRIKILREDEVVRQNCTSDFLEGKIYGYEEVLSFLDTLESEKPSGPTIEEPIDGVLYAAACGIKNATGKSEKPTQEGLEEEIGSYMSNKWRFGCITPITPVVLPNFTTEDLKECARHFAKWGAEHFAYARKTSPNDLEEAANNYLDGIYGKIPHSDSHIDIFIHGAKWGAEHLASVGKTSPKDLEEAAKEFAATTYTAPYVKGSPTVVTAFDGDTFKGFIAGAEWNREQMMKEAVEYEVGMHGEPIKITFDKYVQRARGIWPGDKVRIIIVKEDRI